MERSEAAVGRLRGLLTQAYAWLPHVTHHSPETYDELASLSGEIMAALSGEVGAAVGEGA